MDFGINGKIAIVTGGATGIGYAIAKTFHDEGAVVVINGRDQAKLDKACASIGSRAHGVVADLMTAEIDAHLVDELGLGFEHVEAIKTRLPQAIKEVEATFAG